MLEEICNLLILVSTYNVLACLYAAFRRPLEQMLAEEILTARGNPEAARLLFSQRMERLTKTRRAMRWTIRYGFPQSAEFMLALFETASWLLWPVALSLSVSSYALAAAKPKLVEICNDI